MAVKAAAFQGNLCSVSRNFIVFFHALLLANLVLDSAAFSVSEITRTSRRQIRGVQPLPRNAPPNPNLRLGHSSVFPLFSQWDDSVEVDTSEPTKVSSSTSTDGNARAISRLEKFARLPVWPVWNGVFLFVASKILGQEVAAKLEDAVGGRVCPNFFQSERTSPFIMLVHHRHSFAPWDPLRYLQRTFFPEGFPAHPHRGMFFIVVVYVMLW